MRIIAVLCMLLLTTASGQVPGRAERDPDKDFKNFVARAEQADEEGFTPYWLGRSFESQGLNFVGLHVADFGADVSGGGISMSYAARVTSGGTLPLDIKLYSSEAWNIAENEICEAGHCISQPRDPTRRSQVVLLGREAELLLIAGGTRAVNVAMVLLDTGDTVVVAKAYATDSTTDAGADPNPLIDPDELLRVMEQLSPYPA